MVSVTEKEIWTIKKYYRWPATAVAFLGSGVLELLYWIFLQMIGSIVFHQKGGDDLTFYAGLAVSLLCLSLFLFQMISMIWGVKGKKWQGNRRKGTGPCFAVRLYFDAFSCERRDCGGQADFSFQTEKGPNSRAGGFYHRRSGQPVCDRGHAA